MNAFLENLELGAREIIRATRSRSKIIFKPLPQDDPKQRKPDLTRTRAELGWEPQIELREGLERTADYFRTRLGF